MAGPAHTIGRVECESADRSLLYGLDHNGSTIASFFESVREPHVTLVGRLAQYRYYNMGQCVGAALKASETVLAKLGKETVRPLVQQLPILLPREAPNHARGLLAANQ